MMTAAPLSLDQPLRFHPLTFLEEGDEVTVGRADIDAYALFPPDGAALVRQLEAGSSPLEAAQWYWDQYGERVDMEEFLDVLEDLDLVVHDGEDVAVARRVGWQRLGRALFSPIAWFSYALIVAAGVAAMVRDHRLVPRYQDLFFTHNSLTVLTLGIVLGQVPWMLLHEAFHALAGRRLGLNSKLGIGRRFYYVVFVTSMDGLVAVPRRQRYLPMLAGMLLDLVAISVLTLVAYALASTAGFGALVCKLALCMAFGVVLRLAWQFYFFLRTDLYYLATTVLGCNDLQTASRQLLANRINRLLRRRGRVRPDTSWTPRDLEVARWYSWLMVTGYVFLTTLLVTVMVPAAVHITDIVLAKLRTQHSVLTGLDLVVFLVLNFSEFVFAGYLAVRAFLGRERPPVPAMGPSTSTS
jgi:hypothetical protein